MFERLLWKSDARARLAGLARKQPWDRGCPKAAAAACALKGMLGDRESLLFYHLARSVYAGHGAVVDAGSFLGKSASLFAAGLAGNPVAPPASRKVHCFDNFLVNESGTVEFVKHYCSRDIAIGGSTRDLFDAQVAPMGHMLEVHAGDFHHAKWTAGPIEILMVDIAKSRALWSHLVAEMFPVLVPGVSVVILQDYHDTIQPFMHVGMEFFHPYLEMSIPRVDDSAVFFCREAIPRQMLARVVSDDFTPQERLRLIDAAIERLASPDRFNALLARITQRLEVGEDPQALRRECDDVVRSCSLTLGGNASNNESQRSRVESSGERVRIQIGWRLIQSGEWARAVELADEMLLHRERSDALLMRGFGLNGLGRFREAEETLRRFSERGTQAATHAAVELARAVFHQERHDEAERILLDSLARIDEEPADRVALTRHFEVLRALFAARGDNDKDRIACRKVRQLRPGDPLVEQLDSPR